MKNKVLSIDYYDSFKCTGSKCEDHCCKGWRINVDRSTYNKYKKLKSSEIKKKIDNSINRNRKFISDYDYAKINLIDGKCPMLDENRLCEIYKNLGEENMCYTCRTYPRVYNRVDDVLEKSLTLSCIEVAKNLLLRKNPIEFNLDIIDVENIKIIRNINTSKTEEIRKKYFNEIRAFSIEIIQNRRLSIENRIAVLGLFINNICSNEKEESIVEKSINEYITKINNGYYDNLIDILVKEDKVEAQLEFLTNIYREMMNKKITSNRYIDNFKKIVKSLKLDSEESDTIKRFYIKSLNEHYRVFMKDYEYIYENYLVTYMFKNIFPANCKSLFDSYLNILIHFAILKMNLVGLCGYYKDNINSENVLNLIQSYVAITEHDQFLADKLTKYMIDNDINSLAHGIILIGK